MIESYQIARMRKGNHEYIHLSGFSGIHLTISNLSNNTEIVDLLGNSKKKKKIDSDKIKIHNNTQNYSEDDNNLTMLKNYITSVGYIEIVLFRLLSENPSQTQKEFKINDIDKEGVEYEELVLGTPNPYAFQSGIVDINKRKRVQSETYFSFIILPNTTLNVNMFCGRNRGDVQAKVKSFYNEMQDNITDCQHFVPSMEKGKKRILMLKK